MTKFAVGDINAKNCQEALHIVQLLEDGIFVRFPMIMDWELLTLSSVIRWTYYLSTEWEGKRENGRTADHFNYRDADWYKTYFSRNFIKCYTRILGAKLKNMIYRTQNFTVGADPEVIFNLWMILKIMLLESCCKYNCKRTVIATAFIYIEI